MKLALKKLPNHGLMIVDATTGDVVHGITDVTLQISSGSAARTEAVEMTITLINVALTQDFDSGALRTTVRMVDPRAGAMRKIKAIVWDNGDEWRPE